MSPADIVQDFSFDPSDFITGFASAVVDSVDVAGVADDFPFSDSVCASSDIVTSAFFRTTHKVAMPTSMINDR